MYIANNEDFVETAEEAAVYTDMKDKAGLKIDKDIPLSVASYIDSAHAGEQPTIVVGDLHGKHKIVDAVLALNQPVVFIGDYLDSFCESFDSQIKTITKVLDAVENGKAIALMGNHEMSYLNPDMKSSGYNDSMSSLLMSDFRNGKTIRSAMHELLLPYYFAEGFLISHAGVSNKILKYTNATLDEYLDERKFGDIGWARGGDSRIGGLYWCDWDEEFEPIPYQRQIVGHSVRSDGKIGVKMNSYCIDVLDHGYKTKTIVEIKDGRLSTRNIKIKHHV